MKTLSNNEIARAIYTLSKEKRGAEQKKVFDKVVQFLSRRRLLAKAPLILKELEKIINKETGRVVAHVGSAEKLSADTKSHLVHDLKKRYGAKEVAIIEEVDTKLIGGIKVEANDEVIDLSVKNKIGKLQEYLIKSV